MHAHMMQPHACNIQTTKEVSQTSNSTHICIIYRAIARAAEMIISMGKVSQDTIFEEHELQEVGKGLPRPAKAYNLSASAPRPTPCHFDAMAMKF